MSSQVLQQSHARIWGPRWGLAAHDSYVCPRGQANSSLILPAGEREGHEMCTSSHARNLFQNRPTSASNAHYDSSHWETIFIKTTVCQIF